MEIADYEAVSNRVDPGTITPTGRKEWSSIIVERILDIILAEQEG